MRGFAAFARRTLFVALVVLLAYVAYLLHHVLLLGFGAALVAVLLRALADPIRKRTRLDAAWSLGVTVLALFVVIGGMIFFVGAQVGAQLSQLTDALPAALAKADQQIAQYQWGQWLLERVHEAPKSGAETLAPLAGRIARVGRTSVTALAEVVVVIVAGIYLAAQPGLYAGGLLALFPQGLRSRIDLTLAESDLALRKWLVGTGAAMLAMGVLTTIGATLLHLPAPLALGLLSGLFEFVPVVGGGGFSHPRSAAGRDHGAADCAVDAGFLRRHPPVRGPCSDPPDPAQGGGGAAGDDPVLGARLRRPLRPAWGSSSPRHSPWS